MLVAGVYILENGNTLGTISFYIVLVRLNNSMYQRVHLNTTYVVVHDLTLMKSLWHTCRQKVPEWTPNVQYYSVKEYPRLNHAVNYNVRGTVALPVFEPSTQSCVAVLELIMTSPRINYTSEVDKVCKALEVVPLLVIFLFLLFLAVFLPYDRALLERFGMINPIKKRPWNYHKKIICVNEIGKHFFF